MRGVAALVVGLAVAIAVPATAQEAGPPVPERRIAVTEGTDFYGGDLRAIFDTTFDACRAACLADSACRAFTFNARAGACFPKSDVTSRQPFDGAISAEVFETAPAILAAAGDRAAELSFLRPGDLVAARDAAQQMAELHRVGDFPAADYAQAATEARSSGNQADAVAFSGAAVVLSDAPDLWITYAEDLLAAQGDAGVLSNRQARAVNAAVNGYLRAGDDGTRAAALLAMARALEATGRGRDSLAALRLAADLSPRQDIAEARDRAAAMFGFRIFEHVVESDPATARICAAFSEPLAEAGVDYAPFVQVSAEGTAVEVEDNRLCIAGVRHGERYRVTFRSGLPSAAGDTLAGAVDLDLYVRDRSPAVRFPGRAYVLPRTGDPAVPVVTVNASSLDLVLRRVSDRNILRAMQDGYFGRPLDTWQEQRFSDGVAEEVWRGTGVVEGALNEDTTTRLPMTEAIAGQPPGIYALQARVPGQDPYENAAATQWFVISDLGLATLSGTDGLHVFVRALGTAEPREGVTVTLVSRANAVLGTAETDAQGHAVFPAGLARGTGAAAPGLVTAEDGAEDMAFLSLTDPEFDLSDRGVEGREAAPPIDLFLATDRGAYRAGETIHATALARDGQVAAIDGLPLTAILSRPDGLEYSRALSDTGRAGGHVFAMPVAGSAPRGAWTLAVHADPEAPPLATQTVLVEDFLPERIDFTLTLPDAPIAPSDSPTLTVEARYLFGPPAADLAIDGNVQLAAVRTLDAFPGYLFGRHDAPFDTRYGGFDGGLRTDDDGRAAFPLAFPEIGAADRPLEARVTVTVAEGSGRPVERRLTRALSPAEALIGIRPGFDGVVPEGVEARFDVIAVAPDGARTAMPVTWTLNRIETTYQWYQIGGRWEWEPVTSRSRVASGEAQLSPDGTTTVSAPVEWGQYELRVERADGIFAASSVDFYAGWYAPADASDTPDTLELSLDRPAYAPGDTATVRIVPRFAGKGLVTVMSNRLIAMQAVDLVEGENLVQLPVTDEWGTGAYVAAAVIRPMDVAAGRNPSRALGLAHASVEPGARRLTATFEAPAEAEPRAPLDVALRVEGAAPGQTAWATIAAVDMGILNLTGFESPDPEGHYFGQRKLGVALRDVYGRLIDGMTGSLGEIRSGGDGLAARRIEG
nr:MG2 domain-containing protein [Paracoccaceae bacterium]